MATQFITPTIHSAHPAISWLIPYDRRIIITPLDEGTVREQIAQLVERLNTAPAPGWLSSDARYEGAIAGNTFTISGPIANRRYRLTTRGSIRLHPGGTAIDVTLHLATSHLLATLGQAAFLWGWALIVHFPIVMVLFLTCIMYVLTTALVKSEAAQIVRKLVAASGPQPAPDTRGSIVPDGVGWRCAACGGYVRQDATFCKHCKQRF
jgi:hypothetical protein